MIADGINKAKEKTSMGILLITHYNRILKYINVNKVTIMMNGMIIKDGEKKLADEIESEGYGKYIKEIPQIA